MESINERAAVEIAADRRGSKLDGPFMINNLALYIFLWALIIWAYEDNGHK